jgi:hypothetical protein
MDQQKFGGYQLMVNPMNSHTPSTSLSVLFTLFQQFQIKLAKLQNISRRKTAATVLSQMLSPARQMVY